MASKPSAPACDAEPLLMWDRQGRNCHFCQRPRSNVFFDVRNSQALGVEFPGRSANRRYCGRSVFDSSLPKRDGLPSVDSKILEYTISAVTVLIQVRQQTGTQDISCRKRILSYKRQPLVWVWTTATTRPRPKKWILL